MRFAFIICTLFVLIGCDPGKKKSTNGSLPQPLKNFSAQSPRITLMTWNLENLYDTLDDPKKNDDTYLPMALKKSIPNHFKNCEKLSAKSWEQQCKEWDWNEAALTKKLQRIADVISSVENGQGPDVLVVQEVENLALLERLINDYLPNMNYKAYLLENKDNRGIDVGIISRLPVKSSPTLVSLGGSRPTLNMVFELPDKTTLNLHAVHFPMASSPLEKRLSMLNKLTEINQKINGLSVAMGDFNFPKDEMEKSQLAEAHLLPYWIPVHLYCTDCEGTTYETFTKSWSFLDMILMNNHFFAKNTSWTADPSSLQIYNSLDFQINKYGSPADFTLPYKSGVSDHWPLLIQIVKTN